MRIEYTCPRCGRLFPDWSNRPPRVYCSRACQQDDWVKRFQAFVDKSGECWEWQGYKNNRGYGTFLLKRKLVLAHRISWMIEHGSIPDGLEVCHGCDNPSCVRPDHCFLGTQADNNRDMWGKGRGRGGGGGVNHVKGSAHAHTHLTDSDIRTMRALREAGVKIRILADRFDVSTSNVCFIVNRKTWKHVA